MRTAFLDTQTLIYAFEHRRPECVELVSTLLAPDQYRLVASEETLLEFAQSRSLEEALNLTRSVVGLKPLWLRSFADIQRDEVANFLRCSRGRTSVEPIVAWFDNFDQAASLQEVLGVDPFAFVEAAFQPENQFALTELHTLHGSRLNELSQMVHAGKLTQEKKLQALASAISVRLATGNSHGRLSPAERAEQVRHCIKHRSFLMRTCPSFSVECHLSDYRSSSKARKARSSDSKDLTMSVAAFPYVDLFVTHDGYLFGGLEYVKKKLPTVATKLARPL